MKKLSLFSGRELMNTAPFAMLKFSYTPVPIPTGKNEGKPFSIAKSKEKDADYHAMDAAENEGWLIASGAREEASSSEGGATSRSAFSKIKKALEKLKDSLCGIKERRQENDAEKLYTPKGKDEKSGFSRPPYID